MGDEIEEARESGRERGRRKEERRVMRKGVGKLGGKRKKGYSEEEGKEDGGRKRRSKDLGKEKGIVAHPLFPPTNLLIRTPPPHLSYPLRFLVSLPREF